MKLLNEPCTIWTHMVTLVAQNQSVSVPSTPIECCLLPSRMSRHARVESGHTLCGRRLAKLSRLQTVKLDCRALSSVAVEFE